MMRWLALVVLALTSSCALLTKSAPVVPRYFTPEVADAAPPAATARRSDLAVRLGRVGGGSYLKERMVYRGSEHEVGYYEDRRWTERPEVYLQRALEASLFEERSFTRALSSGAPTVTADLIAFEEVTGSAPHVRLRVSYALHDEATVFLEHTFSVERPLPEGPDASRSERVAAALGVALRDAVSRIADDVAATLGRTAPRGA